MEKKKKDENKEEEEEEEERRRRSALSWRYSVALRSVHKRKENEITEYVISP